MNMQTSKGRPTSLGVSKKTSPLTPRTARKHKTQGSDSELVKQSPAIQKKCPVKVSELELQLVQLQTELKKTKGQLGSSESLKQKAQLENEELRRHLTAMSKKLEESRKQLQDFSDSEEARLQELRKISHDRDRAWQSELVAVQKQNSMDSATLASAMNEVQRLRVQLDRVAESEAAQARSANLSQAEVQNLRMELNATLSLVEELKSQLTQNKESGEKALEEISKAQMQLEVANIAKGTLQSEILKATDAYKSLAFELEQSQQRASKLEEIVAKLQRVRVNTDLALVDNSNEPNQESEEHEESHQLKTELLEAESDIKLEVARVATDKLNNELMEKELQLQNISKENKVLNEMVEQSQSTEREEMIIELENCKSCLAELKADLLNKETELHCITKENDMLRLEVQKQELDPSLLKALVIAEPARASEEEALVKLGHLSEEADDSSAKAAHVIEQLDAAQASNSEMEVELRRLKVQVDQWRKAAEAATAMLSIGNKDKFDERTGSLNNHTLGAKLGSIYFEDMDDESLKKKNGNMLKKIGTLLKKK